MAKAADETAATLAKAQARVARLTQALAKAQAAVDKLTRKAGAGQGAGLNGAAEARDRRESPAREKPDRDKSAQNKPTRDKPGREKPGRDSTPTAMILASPAEPVSAEDDDDDSPDLVPQGLGSDLVSRASHGRLMAALGLAPDALPMGGEWRADIDLMCLVVDHILRQKPRVVVELGAGFSTAVIARALVQAGGGQLWTVHHDPNFLDEAVEMVAGLGLTDRVTAIEAPLGEYADGLWYEGLVGQLPEAIDFLFIDGPPHHAGRFPRHPAGPELFGRMAPGGTVVLDDGKRQKEIKTLARWAVEYPDWRQLPLGTARQAVLLRRG